MINTRYSIEPHVQVVLERNRIDKRMINTMRRDKVPAAC